MRKFLDWLYRSAGYVAGGAMVGLLIMVVANIVSRMVSLPVRGLDAYAGYLMAAAGFLALAHTQRRGEHIRVTLILQKLGSQGKRHLEIYCHVVAVLISGLLSWFSIRLVWQSYQFNDVSQSLDATPLWIPQLAMAFGAVILCIAFVDDFLAWARGNPRVLASDGGEILHLE